MLAIAVTEPDAGNDVQNIQTAARRDGGDWVLDGIKSFITLAGEADVLVLLAQTDRARGRDGMSVLCRWTAGAPEWRCRAFPPTPTGPRQPTGCT